MSGSGVLRRQRRIGTGITAAVLVALLLAPSAALAHGLVGKTDLPIPRWLFAWGAAIVLVVSFVALAALWPKPRLEQLRERELWRYPRILDPLLGSIGVALFVIVVYAGFAGSQEPTANLAPTFIYVLFWVGLVFASLLFGDVFRALNPWRAFARGVAWAARHVFRRELRAPLAYPPWVGRWPAAVGVAAFAWLELIASADFKDSPEKLAILSLVYAGIQLVAMALFGIETWTERGDAFAAYFGLFARLSPLHWEDGRLRLRPPVVGAIGLEMLPGTIGLLVVMIGSTSFDGFSVGAAWASIYPHLESAFKNLGFSTNGALEAAGTVGLLAMYAFVGSLYRLGVLGMRTVGRGHSAGELAERFAHTLLPIALAYVIAHYFSLLAFQGQATAYLISNPLGNGSNLFGTAGSHINYNAVSTNLIWYVQVGALIVGHAAGLTLAHERALTIYNRAGEAIRSQYWMLVVMVGFTSLGLWILSSTH